MATGGKDIARGLAAIQGDRVHGASYLAQEAVRLLAAAVEQAGRQDAERVCRRTAWRLLRIRPGMAPIKNAARAFLHRIQATGFDYRQAGFIGDALVREMRKAVDGAARRAAEGIPLGATVVTCSYSATVVHALGLAHASGKTPRVLALDSGGHGRRLASELLEAGVDVQVVEDAALEEAVRGASLSLVGADRLLPTGAVVNGSPTLSLAVSCRRIRRPFYVVCDSFKLDSARAREAGLDLVSARLVTGVFTELCLTAPRDVKRLATRQSC